jgi:murein DD-endopeptidase MepM/ murein hydrolase activator NlpD
MIGIPGSLQAARPAKKHAAASVQRKAKRKAPAASPAKGRTVAARTAAPRVQAAPAVVVPTLPVAALPSIPIPTAAPAALVHLERLIPGTTDLGAARKTARSISPITSQDLAPVFPPNSGLEYESIVADDLGFLPADPAHLDLLWPVETRSISSSFGPRMRTQVLRVVKAKRKKLVRRRFQGTHKGVDLTAPVGSDVYVVQDGRVTFSGMEKGYGNLIVIDHGNGVETRYAHLKVRFAEVGDAVHRGQKIAEVGMTGRTTGPHLHFEVRLNGDAQDPMPVLNDAEEIPADMMAFNSTVSSHLR